MAKRSPTRRAPAKRLTRPGSHTERRARAARRPAKRTAGASQKLRANRPPGGSTRRSKSARPASTRRRAALHGPETYTIFTVTPQANQKAAIFPELQGLFAKTVGLVDILRESLMPLAEQVRAAFVFGSAARGELHASSDVDLLVVGDVSFGDVITAIQGAEKRLGRDVNPTVFSEDEFRTKVLAKHHFVTSVLGQPKMFVLGEEDHLRPKGAKKAVPESAVAHSTPQSSSRSGRRRRG